MANWSDRIRAYAALAGEQTAKALQRDAEMVRDADEVQKLRAEQTQLKAKLEAVDHSVDLIWAQQDTLMRLCAGLEKRIVLRPSGGGAPPVAPGGGGGGCGSRPATRSDQRARGLQDQLDELSRQIRELSEETSAFRASPYAPSPLAAAAHALNAHSSELDSIQKRMSAAEKKLRATELCVDEPQRDQHA
eukprot:NODE_15519_length_1046_cov_3.526659.p1 GENE.NODE_15519_length_1046_cov_3.526659~~NODE_15519_length_1046_cov_3.526659.p1  ORF type:complete len:190 (+),score=53.66 NODE_15519_length_1046_cov_3.526659:256-825(+)